MVSEGLSKSPFGTFISGKLGLRLGLAVFLSIIVVEAAILAPSYLNYEHDLLVRLEHTGRASIISAFKTRSHARDSDLLIFGRLIVRDDEVAGGALYRPDGGLIGTFGTPPRLTKDEWRSEEVFRRRDPSGKWLDVVWPPLETGLPWTVAGRLDARWIAPTLRAFVWRIMGLVLVISVFVCGATMLIFHRLVLKRVLILRDRLETVTSELATPSGQLLPVGPGDELGDVMSAFNSMTERISRDFTALEKERALRAEREESLRAILENAVEAIITISSDGRVETFNQAAQDLFGFARKDIIGRNVSLLMPEPDRGNHNSFIETYLSTGKARILGIGPREITAQRKDGTNFPAELNIGEYFQGPNKRFVGTLRDITERKEAQAALLTAKEEADRANKAKSEFLGKMSHELRTPLNAIIGFADILSHRHLGSISEKKSLEYAEDIYTSGVFLLELVNDVLDISTIEAGEHPLAKEKVALQEIVLECTNVVSDAARRNQIDLTIDIPEDLPFLYADRRAVRQILINLLSNAIKYSPEGGRVKVSATASKKQTKIKVVDTGVGIPAKILPKLTDPFVRVEEDFYLSKEGTGLGLSIVKSLVELNGGKLSIKSKVGKGTTVIVTLPNAAP